MQWNPTDMINSMNIETMSYYFIFPTVEHIVMLHYIFMELDKFISEVVHLFCLKQEIFVNNTILMVLYISVDATSCI